MSIKKNTYFLIREACPGCKSFDYEIIYSCGFLEPPIKEYLESFYTPQGGIEFGYLQNAQYSLAECKECGIIFQKEIPNDDLLKHLYDDRNEAVESQEHFPQGERLDYYCDYAKEIMILMAFFGGIPGNLKFFDFGMGWGKWCMMAQAFGCECYGTDISSPKVVYAKSHGIKVINWEEIPEYRFDFINIDQVFEHIAEPLETLRYLKQSIKPQGLIKINIPEGRDIKRRLRIGDWKATKWTKNSLNAVAPLEHINCYQRSAVVSMAERVGLKPVTIPLMTQLYYATNWRPGKPAMKNILFPLFRNLLGRGICLYFRIG